MFNKKLNADAFTSLISEGMSVNGTICFQGILKVEGLVVSPIIHGEYVDEKDRKSHNNTLIVSKTGSVTSDKIIVTNAIIEGALVSPFLSAEDTVRITKTAKITNTTIYYRTLEIEPGAHIHDVKMIHADFSSATEFSIADLSAATERT